MAPKAAAGDEGAPRVYRVDEQTRRAVNFSRWPSALIPSDERKRKLLLPHPLHTDEFFREWPPSSSLAA